MPTGHLNFPPVYPFFFRCSESETQVRQPGHIVTLRSTMKAGVARANADPWGHCGFLFSYLTSYLSANLESLLSAQVFQNPDHFAPCLLGLSNNPLASRPVSLPLLPSSVPWAGLIPGLASGQVTPLTPSMQNPVDPRENENQSLANDLEDSVQ